MTDVTEDMIGCLCWFWDRCDEDLKEMHTLKNINSLFTKDINGWERETPYMADTGDCYEHCRPVEPEEIKFYNHIGDVNEKDELATKCSQLKEENKKLKERLADASKTIYTQR